MSHSRSVGTIVHAPRGVVHCSDRDREIGIARENGVPVPALAEKYGLSRHTIHSAFHRFKMARADAAATVGAPTAEGGPPSGYYFHRSKGRVQLRVYIPGTRKQRTLGVFDTLREAERAARADYAAQGETSRGQTV